MSPSPLTHIKLFLKKIVPPLSSSVISREFHLFCCFSVVIPCPAGIEIEVARSSCTLIPVPFSTSALERKSRSSLFQNFENAGCLILAHDVGRLHPSDSVGMSCATPMSHCFIFSFPTVMYFFFSPSFVCLFQSVMHFSKKSGLTKKTIQPLHSMAHCEFLPPINSRRVDAFSPIHFIFFSSLPSC